MKNNQMWWKNAVVYQVYMQSFKDSNNDGFGDIPGLISKLDYLENLGVNALWLTPIYKSPLVDNGYDIADYKSINDLYGGMESFKELLKETKKRNLKIIMDIVVNHTSDQHFWFQESKRSKDNPYRDYYIWRDKPTNKKSIFGGDAWTYDESTKQYYLHQFTPQQPDLNWENPKLRAEVSEIIKFWCDLGVGGFRFDVIDLIGKEVDKDIWANGPNLHKFIKEMRTQSWNSDIYLTVGECWGATLEDGEKYSSEKSQEFSMVFQFEHVTEFQHQLGKYKPKEVDFIKLKNIISKWQKGLFNKGWNSIFLMNHDLPRAISKYGNDREFRVQSAKTLAATMFMLQGTKYIYQGEEIGMTNTYWTDISKYKDIEIVNSYKDLVEKDKVATHDEFILGLQTNGRDHARTPMQWSSGVNSGFSNTTPWIEVNPNFKSINVESDLSNPESILNFYKNLIKIKNRDDLSEIIINGNFSDIDLNNPKLWSFKRESKFGEIIVFANWSDEKIKIDIDVKEYEVIINTEKTLDANTLKPWQTVIIYKSYDKIKK